jgi:hypothetical protein
VSASVLLRGGHAVSLLDESEPLRMCASLSDA